MKETIKRKYKIKLFGNLCSVFLIALILIFGVIYFLNPAHGWFSSNIITNTTGMGVVVSSELFELSVENNNQYPDYPEDVSIVKYLNEQNEYIKNPTDARYETSSAEPRFYCAMINEGYSNDGDKLAPGSYGTISFDIIPKRENLDLEFEFNLCGINYVPVTSEPADFETNDNYYYLSDVTYTHCTSSAWDDFTLYYGGAYERIYVEPNDFVLNYAKYYYKSGGNYVAYSNNNWDDSKENYAYNYTLLRSKPNDFESNYVNYYYSFGSYIPNNGASWSDARSYHTLGDTSSKAVGTKFQLTESEPSGFSQNEKYKEYYIYDSTTGEYVQNRDISTWSSNTFYEIVPDDDVLLGDLLSGHILLFKNRQSISGSTKPYYYSNMIEDSIKFSTTETGSDYIPYQTVTANGETHYRITIYWVWPMNFAQMVFEEHNEKLRTNSLFGSNTEIENMVNYISENSNKFFVWPVPTEIECTGDYKNNYFVELSNGYNNADQTIGDNAKFLAVEVIVR